MSFPNGKTTELFESIGVSLLCSLISTISTTAYLDIGLECLREKERKKLQPIEGADKV